MSDVFHRRRYPEVVVGRAVVVGVVSSIPVALLALLLPVLVRALASGASPRQALAATALTDDEDVATLPLFLLGALVLGALIALVAAGVWYIVAARVPSRSWVAHLAATLTAMAVPLLIAAGGEANKTLAMLTALAAGLIALVAAPRVGYERSRRGPVTFE